MNASTMNVIISGASGGIGSAITLHFLRAGANVLAVGRRGRELSELQQRANGEGFSLGTVAADVSEATDVERIMGAAFNLWPMGPSVLINAAGIYGPKNLLEECAPEEWVDTVKVNLFGTMLLTRAVLPSMKKQKKGVIINFSGGGDGAFPRFSAYVASKGAVVRFTESVAAEAKAFGVRVNAIAPGAVNSRLLDEAIAAGEAAVGSENYARFLQQKRTGGVSPDKAAALCIFLASDASERISGRVLSAVWDDIDVISRHQDGIINSDIYTVRRIKPSDRGFDWK